MNDSSQPVYHLLQDTPWENPGDAPAELKELAAKAAATGARRAQVTTGAIGFHSQLSEMPAGFEVPPHSHSAHELMVVFEGGCQVVGGPELNAGDIAEIPKGTAYGFKVGANGIRFMVIRPEASITKIS